MEERWRNLGIILAVIVAAVLIYLFVLPLLVLPPTGEVNLAPMEALFEENEIDPAYATLDSIVFFDENGELVEMVSAEQLNALESDFKKYLSGLENDSSATTAQKKAASLYLEYLAFAKEKMSFYKKVAGLGENCEAWPEGEDFEAKSDELLLEGNRLNEEVEGFLDEYNEGPLFYVDLDSDVALNQNLESIYVSAWTDCFVGAVE